MTAAALRHAMAEARRFLAAAEKMEREASYGCGYDPRHARFYGPLAAAVKRASMDLTKAPPPLRRP